MSTARKPAAAPLSAYVLHRWDWSESSLIVELFTRERGRLAVAAKGAKRPYSQLRPVLIPFQRLWVQLGKAPADEAAEVHLLRSAERAEGPPMPGGGALFAGFYLNELLLKLMARDDPHPGLYGHYEEALATLRDGQPASLVLRRFERRMLAELGYALVLAHDVHGEPVQPQRTYCYVFERGPLDVEEGVPDAESPEVSGQALLDMERDEYADAATLQQAKALMRYVVNRYLGGKPLHTRQLLREMQQL